jgi:hypothetical protein
MKDETRLSDLIAEFDGGFLDMEATYVWREMIKQIRNTGASGEVTLKFSVKADNRIEDGVIVAVKVGSKIPRPQPNAKVYRSSADGSTEELDRDVDDIDDEDDGLGDAGARKVTPINKARNKK